MFKIDKIYKNRNCIDIVFLIKQIKKEENGFQLYGEWLNRHYDLILICEETIFIPNEKVEQWAEYTKR